MAEQPFRVKADIELNDGVPFDEESQDAAAIALVTNGTHSGLTAVYDDAGDGIDFTVTDAPTLQGNDSAHHLARANHTGTQLSGTISDFTEAAQDAIGNNMLTGTQTLIAVTYDDANNELDFVVDDSTFVHDTGNETVGGEKTFTNNATFSADVTVTGNLTVNGTTTTVNSNTVEIGDNIIVLNSDETGAPSQDAGVEVERGTSTNVRIAWNETTDVWEAGVVGTLYEILTTNSALSKVGDVTITSIAAGELLKWNGTAWINQTLNEAGVAAASHTHLEAHITDLQAYLLNITAEPIGDLSNVTITSIAAGEVLKWNGTAFINNTLVEAGIAAASHTHLEAHITDLQSYLLDITAEPIQDLSNVTVTAVASGEILKYNGSAWVNNTLVEAGIAAGSHTHTSGDMTDFAEAVSDQVGTMVTGNTQTLIAVTYDDADNTLDFVVDDSNFVHKSGTENDIGGDKTFLDNVTVTGNLTVNGTTTTVNSNTVEIGDNIIVLNSDETGTPSQDAGVEIERGTSTNARIQWDEAADAWECGLAGSETRILTTADEGSGNLLDADTVDTYEAADLLDADNHVYSNATSGLTATDTQAAIDELAVTSVQTGSASLSTTVADMLTFAAATYRAVKVTYSATRSTDYQAGEVLINHNGTTANKVEYAVIHSTADTFLTLTADISTGNVRLRGSVDSGTGTLEYKYELIDV